MIQRWYILLLVLCLSAMSVQARRVTHRFDNVSMSDALRYLQNQTDEYQIVFIFNELEDFSVTANVKNQTVPEAIRQLIGFYPIAMTTKEGGREIYVECTHKTEYRLIGRLLNEKSQPLEYANVTLLHPSDSSYITGGVTNASGTFVIPVEQPTVIARISHVGYKTVYRRCKSSRIGTIKMERSITSLKGAQVTTPVINMQHDGANYTLTNLGGTVMGNAGNALDLLRWTPGVVIDDGDNIKVIGRDKTLVYINNRLVNNVAELSMLNSHDIKRIEVIRDPDAQYASTADAIIRIYTHSSLKNYLGASVTDVVDFKHKVSNATTLTIDGKYNKLSGNVSMSYNHYNSRSSNTQYTHIYNSDKNDTIHYEGSGDDYRVFAGINYALTPRSVLGLQYNGSYSKTGIDLEVTRQFLRTSSNSYYMIRTIDDNDMKLGSVSNSFSASYSWQPSDDAQLLVIADYATSRQTNDQKIIDRYFQQTQKIHYSNDYDITTATARYDFGTRGWQHKTGLEWGHAGNYGEATKGIDTQQINRDNDWAAAYYSVGKQWRRWHVSAGLRYEYDHTSSVQDVVIRYKKDYHDVLPQANVEFSVNSNFDLTANYRRTLVRPSYNQLRSTFYFNILPYSSLGYSALAGTDFIAFPSQSQAVSPSNSLSPGVTYVYADDVATGNPLLRPTVTDRVSVAARYRHINAQVSYRHVNNGIQTIHQLLQSGTLRQSPININPYHAWTLDLDYSLSTDRLSLYLLASGTLPHITIPMLGLETEKRPYGLLHGNVQYNVLRQLMLGCSVLYSTPWTAGYTRCNSLLGLNLSVRATFFKGRLMLGANYHDVLNRGMSTRSETNYLGVFNSVEVNNDSRSIQVIARWTFNTINNPFKRRSGNDAPLQRTQETVN
ncbi:MAG: TonB-dependent receptor [Muribaculaceae bacterium]|nr:TonB-dependent receptor [Muribaculaceae bacterium]